VTATPVADSYIDSSAPTTTHGTLTSLRADGSPTVNSYLRFNLTGVSGTVTSATLRVFATTAQSTGYDAYSVADNTWGEATITSANAPPFGATKLGSSGKITAATWTSVDVTSAVTGNGTYSFGISTANATAVSFSSRDGANPPQLVVTYAGSGAMVIPPPGRPGPLPFFYLLIPLVVPGLVLLQRQPIRRLVAGYVLRPAAAGRRPSSAIVPDRG
jgi:hypothetical protein